MEENVESRPILPPDVCDLSSEAFEPRNDWLARAEPAQQKEAMHQWFEARYQDPFIETPMQDGEFIYVNGGPYHASDLLHSRFAGVVDEALQHVLAEELSAESWDWVPKRAEEFDIDFDVDLLIEPPTREAPLYLFNHRMEELAELVDSQKEPGNQLLLNHMVYGAYISALEAYLAETMSYWIQVNEGVLKKFVKTHPEFKNQKISVAEVFDTAATMGKVVEDRLNKQVWHRFNDVRLMFQEALDIKMPPIAELMKAVQIRHDIVHRAGRQKGGLFHVLNKDAIQSLSVLTKDFVGEIEKELGRKFPQDF